MTDELNMEDDGREGMSEITKQQLFKKGDMACLILRVTEFQPSISTEEDNSRVIFDCTKIKGISTEYAPLEDIIFVETRLLRPAPREGEYGLTPAEIYRVCMEFTKAVMAGEVHQFNRDEREAWIKAYCEKRKEARHD